MTAMWGPGMPMRVVSTPEDVLEEMQLMMDSIAEKPCGVIDAPITNPMRGMVNINCKLADAESTEVSGRSVRCTTVETGCGRSGSSVGRGQREESDRLAIPDCLAWSNRMYRYARMDHCWSGHRVDNRDGNGRDSVDP